MGLEKINDYKKIKGLTNRRISEITGISISSLDKITSGENTNPKLGTVRAICDVLDCTLDDLMDEQIEITASNYTSNEEMEKIKKYRALGGHGKKIVDYILNEEYERCSTAAEAEPTIKIKHSIYRASAGFGFDLEDRDEWDEIDIPDTPEARSADFAVTIFGNSMEPIYHDNDIVLVKIQDRVNIGETGIFVVNGQGYIKQYGGDRLISVNSEYDDIVFTEGDYIKCAGKVIGIA